MKKIDLEKYVGFVDNLTSNPSKNFNLYIAELNRLHSLGCNIERLDCALTGLNSESGEALDLVKKLKYHSKDWNEDIKVELIKEAGDIIFYWINLCLALDLDPNEIIAVNVEKLQGRHPAGVFNPFYDSKNEK
jgi:NTP pyrophosphatase (non-canonical NTP hydrolase)